MTFIGHLHPMLVHFPIALILIAAVAELLATVAGSRAWRAVALANVRVGAFFAVVTAIVGWLLASSLAVDDQRMLEWHRWIGTAAAVATIVAALTTARVDGDSPKPLWRYRIAVFSAAALVGFGGHLGGLLVWGADFLRP